MDAEPNNPNNFPFPFTVFGFVVAIFITLLYFIGGGHIAQMLTPANGSIESNPAAMRISQALAQVLFMLIPALAITRVSPLGTRLLLRFDASAITPKHWFVVIVSIPLIQIFGYAWSSVQDAILPAQLVQWLANQSEETQTLYITLLGGFGIVDFLTAIVIGALIPAVAEEILFRGVMQRSIEQQSGIPIAIVHTSMLFMLIHFNPAQSITLLALAILLSVVAATSRSLIPSIIMHLLNNTLAVCSLYIQPMQSLDESAVNLSLPFAVPLLLLSTSGIIACVWLLLRKPQKLIFTV